jgi:hypothetical protein
VLIYPVYALMISACRHWMPGSLAWLFVIWSRGRRDIPGAGRGYCRSTGTGATSWLLPSLIKASGFLVWWLLAGLCTGFALGFVLWGAGSAFWSGTAEAWLYEALQRRRPGCLRMLGCMVAWTSR